MWRGRQGRRRQTDPYALILLVQLAQQIAQMERKPPVTLAAIASMLPAPHQLHVPLQYVLCNKWHLFSCHLEFGLITIIIRLLHAACFMVYYDEFLPVNLRPPSIQHACLQPYLIVQVGQHTVLSTADLHPSLTDPSGLQTACSCSHQQDTYSLENTTQQQPCMAT